MACVRRIHFITHAILYALCVRALVMSEYLLNIFLSTTEYWNVHYLHIFYFRREKKDFLCHKLLKIQSYFVFCFSFIYTYCMSDLWAKKKKIANNRHNTHWLFCNFFVKKYIVIGIISAVLLCEIFQDPLRYGNGLGGVAESHTHTNDFCNYSIINSSVYQPNAYRAFFAK